MKESGYSRDARNRRLAARYAARPEDFGANVVPLGRPPMGAGEGHDTGRRDDLRDAAEGVGRDEPA